MATKSTFKENVLRVVAVVGLIAVLLLGAWGIIQLAFFIPGFLSNIAGSIVDRTPTTQTETINTTTTTTSTSATPPVQTTATKPATVAASKSASTAKISYVPSGKQYSNLFGYPDLQVRILNQPANVRAGSQVSLQFVIENVGTNVAHANWFFTASLPYSPAYTYQSPTQQALYPGDKIVYTLGYSAIDNYAGSSYYQYNQYPVYATVQSASITADPYNLVWELNEGNNAAGISYQVY